MFCRFIVTLSLLSIYFIQETGNTLAVEADSPYFTAPVNNEELAARVVSLRRYYEPFLRSLPAPLKKRERTMLPEQWKFTFEAKETPKAEGLPPAPPWHTADFDDSRWETTTVPEWRYRMRESDTAVDPQRIGVWQDSKTTTADTICWYRTIFEARKPADGQRLWLCFDGVDWEAQVYLNGELLGTHQTYYEPFRFDVTDKMKATNTLAVRVIAGRSYGEPMTYWTLFPDIRAAEQRYVPDRSRSIRGHLPLHYSGGCGFGIFGDVYLERSGKVLVRDIFARNDLSDGNAHVKVELDSDAARSARMSIEILPENFEGRSYQIEQSVDLPKGLSEQTLAIPMPDAGTWSPETPYLYRCKVSVAGQDAKDVLFGCRSFSIVNRGNPDKSPADTDANQLPNGMLMINGRPIYLRGTNIQGLNAYSYWGQNDQLLHALLLLKAGNFNSVRSCQHVELPHVREMMDRMGIMSEQDQGGGYRGSIDMGVRRKPHIHTGTVLARICYNNPGVVLLSFGNEHQFDVEPILRAALAVDPQRIIVPISGRFTHTRDSLVLPDDLWPNVIDDGHPYSGWYGRKIFPQTWYYAQTWKLPRMVLLGEFGAEALDAYETMRDNYPPQSSPPPPDSDSLWGASQVEKHSMRQIAGFGRNPVNLREYIEASQNYQEALLADKIIGMRLSPRSVGGYFHFHFLDVIPAYWPKSIVSHDHRPKKAFFQLAQINQPVVALPELLGAKPDTMRLWIANDLDKPFNRCKLSWTIVKEGETALSGSAVLDVPSLNAVAGPKIDLHPIVANAGTLGLTLTLSEESGRIISRYTRQLRCVPDELLKTNSTESKADPYNKPNNK